MNSMDFTFHWTQVWGLRALTYPQMETCTDITRLFFMRAIIRHIFIHFHGTYGTLVQTQCVDPNIYT